MKIRTLLFLPFIFLSFSTQDQLDSLVDISSLSTEFAYQIRYATPYNFMEEALYDCPKCLLRPEVAEALLKANQYFCEMGYRIKLFDCYRPLEVQKRMWAKYPRPTYVANPHGNGSVHNRGAAVDLTLETSDGCFVEMGSDYDYFGREAHIDYFNFPKEILAHRKLLFEGMRKFGFSTIRTEWWHFSFNNYGHFEILNTPLPCN